MAYATTTQLASETASRKSADFDLDARIDKLEAWIAAHPDAPVVPPVEPPVAPPVVTPPVAPATSGVYGTGISGDSRSNHQIGWTNRSKLDYRFRARGGTVKSIKVQERGGPSHDQTVPTYGYSWGNGGLIKASIQGDNAGLPSGTILGSVQWAPGNPVKDDGKTPSSDWEKWPEHLFPTQPNLTPNGLYHLVFENVAADQVGNYMSLNVLYTMGTVSSTPRQAAFSDDFAALYGGGLKPWALMPNDVPIFDLAYTDGGHDGSAYIGTLADKFGIVSGGQNMVRERFTPRAALTVAKAHVRVKRIGGIGPLLVALTDAAGTVLTSAGVPSSAIAQGSAPPGNLAGDTWAHAAFAAPRILDAGVPYSLRLSTDASTTYTAVPIQQGTSKGLASRVFGDGDGQRTTDGGANWSNLYAYDYVDLQFWLD